MANLEKLVKAFEVLKVFQPGNVTEEPIKLGKKEQLPPTKKEKMTNCNVIADCICYPNLRSVADFPKFLGIAVETFLMLCDDFDPDVRMVADECLNRTVKTLLETNLGRLQVELYKEIKKNGSSRTLRAALWRFAEMCYLIRPQKCRPYVVNLLPCIARICQREEEAIQETLSTAMQKIAPVLMSFATDNEIKILLKSFLPNLKSSSASTRRTAANSLTLVCQYTRKPMVFFKWLLDILLDMVIPVNDERNVPCLLGVLLCIRHLLPHLSPLSQEDQSLQGSFGRTQKEKEVKVTIQTFLQIYEFLLYYTDHANHNVITASLETLQQMLRNPPPELVNILVTPASVTRTTIYEKDQIEKTRRESQSDLGVPDDTESSSTDDSAQVMADLGDLERDVPPGGKPEEPVVFESGDSPQPPDVADEDIVLDEEGSAYSDLEIGAMKDGTNISASSSDGMLSDKVELAQTLRRGASEDLLNANTEYDDAFDAENDDTGDASVTHVPTPACIGSFTGPDAPVMYCVRLICSRFLLSGNPGELIADRSVRVSIKTLAMGCVTSVVTFYPQAVLCHLYKDNQAKNQPIKDVLLFGSHSDPQLKGCTAVLAAHILKSFLLVTRGRFDLDSYFPQGEQYKASTSVKDLVQHIVDGLLDDNSVTSRLTLVTLKGCLDCLLHSVYSLHGLYILLKLTQLRTNPYWLVKVELLELLGLMDMKLISYLESVALKTKHDFHTYIGEVNLQSCIVNDVVLSLLGDDDFRVRHAASTAIVRLIPNLYYVVDHQDPVTAVSKDLTKAFLHPIIHEWSQPPPPVIHGLVWPYHHDCPLVYKQSTELNLSRIVAVLMSKLIKSTTKHLTSGCCHALFTLSEAYPITLYGGAWCCSPCTAVSTKHSLPSTPSKNSISGYNFSSISLDELSMGAGGGSLPLILSLLTSSSVTLDLNTHQDSLHLAANLFAGAAYKCLKKVEDPGGSNSNSEDSRWGALQDRLLVSSADNLLSHLAKLLNICSHIIEEQVPGPPHSKPVLPSLPTAASISPMRKKTKDKDATTAPAASDAKSQSSKLTRDKDSAQEKEKNKKESLGTFYNLPHYTKLFDNLKGAYSNYQISLDLNVSDKFGSILKATLQVFSVALEVACLPDVGKYAEEFLSYLKTTVAIQPTYTILCVQQLLKSLFGTNLACQFEGSSSSLLSRTPRLGIGVKPGLYQNCFSSPYAYFTQSVHSSTTLRDCSQDDQEEGSSLLCWLRRRAEKKIPAVLKPGSKTDKNSIACFIRLFEPLVIKALKQYTVTSSLDLQKQVLQLLTQLVQLRVNYCLLDSDQIFIGFVIKQFEYIEEGQIRDSEILVPCIFHFLVLLSYERYHSKAIIGMPKIIQLCDGIMASGMNPVTHAIPALQPIVYDLFVLRGTNKADVSKDLDTQREVVISMMFRLIQYYQVLELFIVVLHQGRRESDEKWKRLSRQVVDILFPYLGQLQINLDNQKGLDVVHRLMESVAPSVFRPVDVLLTMLYAPIFDVASPCSLHRWLGSVLVILRVFIAQSKEEVVLSRQQELNIAINIFVDSLTGGEGSRPLSTTETPEELFARFLLQVVGLVSMEIHMRTVNVAQSLRPFLCQQLSHLLLYITHMFQSGQFRRVATSAMSLLRQPSTPEQYFCVETINKSFLGISSQFPTLSLQWCNILILLNYDDQTFWSQIMQTPRRYGLTSPRQPEGGSVADLPLSHCCNFEIMRYGGLILFCDYVCENLNDAEHITWVIVNHVSDLIELSHEPPVQDLISAIHRNSAASGLLIQAIHSRCGNLSKPGVVKKTLQSLEAVHLSQSGALLTLLVDKFLNTHHLAVARMCDSIACRRVEMLLTEGEQECSSQMPLEDLEKLLQFMKLESLTRRHARLASLLNKLRNRLCPESCLTLSPEKTHPLVLARLDMKKFSMEKELYVAITQDQSFHGTCPQETAALLSKLSYSDILAITMTKEFHLPLLAECIKHGTQLALGANTPTNEHPLLQAAQLTLLRHLNNLVNMLPVPHTTIQFSETDEEQYSQRLQEVLTDPCWTSSIPHFTSALLEYLHSLNILPGLKHIPDEAVRDVCRVALLSLEAVHSFSREDHVPSTEQLGVSLKCMSAVLQNPQCRDMMGQEPYLAYVCSSINCLYQVLCAMLLVPGEHLTPCARIPDLNGGVGSVLKRTCQQVSDLVFCLTTRLSDESHNMPSFLIRPLRRVIVGLARLPMVNSYARTPSCVWKYGWSPSVSGGRNVKLPPLPVEFLQEKDVLQEFIFRVLNLGWTSRQQFEETWMSLLGVLNPVPLSEEMHVSPEEEVHRCQCTVLAVRCITGLLLQSTLTPTPGNPCCEYEHRPRDKPLAFLSVKCGKRLTALRGYLENEIVKLTSEVSPADVSHIRENSIFCGNMEKEPGCLTYSLGQMSTESIWSVLGMLESQSYSEESDEDKPIQPLMLGIEMRERSSSLSGLDLYSCLQFLLDMYSQWLSSSGTPTPLMQINETVKSIVALSDVFTEKHQFEWMFDTLVELQRVHPIEDEIMNQYMVVGLCKAVAVIGMDIPVAERISKIIETNLRSAHLSTRISSLWGALYILETGINEASKLLIPVVTEYLLKHISAVSHTSINVQQHMLLLWAMAFYILENFQEEIEDTDISDRLLQLATNMASSSEEVTTLVVYVVIMKGLERLVLANVLSKPDVDTLVKLSVDRLSLSCPQRALPALALMLTCMYAGKQEDAWTPSLADDPEPPSFDPSEAWPMSQDPESLIIAMERVTVLFDRIRKGFPCEARLLTRILPSFLADFFPSQDIMNKVIGEFLSNQQPHPQLMASVLFQVFERLISRGQHLVVRDWVMLSLSNFTQRTPLSMAVWSLTCFFICSSTNSWLRALLPHVTSRMGKMEAIDHKLFCIAASDFFQQLPDASQKRTFISTFQSVTLAQGNPYMELLQFITDL